MPSSTVSSTAAQEAWGHFWQIFVADKPRRMAILNELGLAPMQSMALMQLRADEPLAMSALAEALMCDNSNVTGIVDRLEAMGLAERRPAERDRRVKTIVLTPKGVNARAEAERRMSVPPPAFAALSDADAATLRDILERALASQAARERPRSASA
jgi:DNA-binding MarR family transcriptional regulator